MADSATPRAAEPPPPLVAVAYSGGRDSTALLHATALAAAKQGLRVLAIHIHHGLNPRADDWAEHARAQVANWAQTGLPVQLLVHHLQGRPAAGESVEAWARQGRHHALQALSLAAGADLLLLAHHRRDQAETFVLQALRGRGVAGLAAMPAQQWRQGLCWARPWLEQPADAVQAYVHAHGLSHIEDDSNQDLRYARNALRHKAWPALLALAPGAEAGLAQAAQWAQQALALQQELADADLAQWADEQGLRIAMLQALSPARAANALRAWLQRRMGQPAPASLVRRLQAELLLAESGHWPAPRGRLQRYRSHLCWSEIAGESGTPDALPGQAGELVDLSAVGEHALPGWAGVLRVREVDQGGVAASRLNKVELRPREGGTQFQASPLGCPRSLKKAWQSAGVPQFQREGPLIWGQGQLIFVPGLGLDARVLAAVGEPQRQLSWHPRAC